MSDTRFPINAEERDRFAALPTAAQGRQLRQLLADVNGGRVDGELVASFRAAIYNAGDYCPTLDTRSDQQWARDNLQFLLAGYDRS